MGSRHPSDLIGNASGIDQHVKVAFFDLRYAPSEIACPLGLSVVRRAQFDVSTRCVGPSGGNRPSLLEKRYRNRRGFFSEPLADGRFGQESFENSRGPPIGPRWRHSLAGEIANSFRDRG